MVFTGFGGNRSVSHSGGGGSAWGGSKSKIINELILNGGDLNKLPSNLRNTFINAASPEELKEYTNRNSAATAATPAPAAAPAPASAPTPAPGGAGIDANALMEMYQKGLGAGEASAPKGRSLAEELQLLKGQSDLELANKAQTESMQTENQLRLLREGNNLDLARKRVEQDMQMEGQRTSLDQTQKARAKERETEAMLQRRQQSTERSNAMAAYRGL